MQKSKWYTENEQKIQDVKRFLQQTTMSNTAVESQSLVSVKEVLYLLMNRVAYLETVVPEDKKQ